ncbi:hypothetical protein EYV94_08205 [Puteibacter caeruleilacunae]|nr:hypothetical protein EYV94_08205 [Puteibacter caeruleilacunae]
MEYSRTTFSRYLTFFPVDKVFLFLLWPLGGLWYAIKNNEIPSAKLIMVLFFTYFGFVFVFADPLDPNGADSARYAMDLIEMHRDSYGLGDVVSMLYSSETDKMDIYQPLATWIISLFTEDARFLFALFGGVFGYFYASNILMVLRLLKDRMDIMVILFLIAYVLVNPIWNINGVRMWTAAQIFLYGVLRYLLYEEKAGIYWCLMTPLVHLSFVIPIGLLFGWMLLPNNITVLFIAYILASLLSEVNLNFMESLDGYVPSFLQSRMESYGNEAYVEKLAEISSQNSWHVHFAKNALGYVRYVWIIVAYMYRKTIAEFFPDFNKLFGLGLFVGAFAQLVSSMPSGGRFLVISDEIIFALFVFMFSYGRLEYRTYILRLITIPIVAFVLIFQFRVGCDYMGILTFLGNPIIALFIDDQTPVIEFVKSIF